MTTTTSPKAEKTARDQNVSPELSDDEQELLKLIEQKGRSGDPFSSDLIEKIKATRKRGDQQQVKQLTEALKQGSDEAFDRLIEQWKQTDSCESQTTPPKQLAQSQRDCANQEGVVAKPYALDPVGMLKYEGHEVLVWSLVCTEKGQAILLNCTGPDASISACFMKLIKSKEVTITFVPANTLIEPWRGPTELVRAESSYTLLRSALPEVQLKNHCLIAKSVHVIEGLKRPEIPPETTESTSDHAAPPKIEPRPRYIVANEGADRPPQSVFYANLRSKQVVCLLEWEDTLWQRALDHGLIHPMPALGVSAWSLEPDLIKWTDLVKEGCLARWWNFPAA